MSTTDPDATIMLSKDGAHLGYQTHYVVDGGKARIILAALVAPAEVMENQPMRGSASSAPVFAGSCGLGRSPVIANTVPKRTLSPLKPSTFARIWRFLITITARSSLARIASATKWSVISTCVQQAKNCIRIGLTRLSVRCAIVLAPKTAITVRSKPSVPPVNKDERSAEVSMRSIWIG